VVTFGVPVDSGPESPGLYAWPWSNSARRQTSKLPSESCTLAWSPRYVTLEKSVRGALWVSSVSRGPQRAPAGSASPVHVLHNAWGSTILTNSPPSSSIHITAAGKTAFLSQASRGPAPSCSCPHLSAPDHSHRPPSQRNGGPLPLPLRLRVPPPQGRSCDIPVQLERTATPQGLADPVRHPSAP